jgi:hypothetical protein
MSGGGADVGKHCLRSLFVIPAKAEIQAALGEGNQNGKTSWIPAFAGMTG